jgi:DNA-binding transcriptional regulator YdaS (Cro superfamily)
MTPQQIKKLTRIFDALIDVYGSQKELAIAIQEHKSDISLWHRGKKQVTVRAIINICRLHKQLSPYDLNPDLFPSDLEFVYSKGEVKK